MLTFINVFRSGGFVFFLSWLSLTPIAAQTHQNDTTAAYSYLLNAQILNDSAQYKRAEIPAKAAYEIFRAVLGVQHEKTAEAALQYGIALNRQRKTSMAQMTAQLEAAIVVLRVSIDWWSVYPSDHPDHLAMAWFDLGYALQRTDRIKEALDAYQHCLALRQGILPENDLRLAAVFKEIGEMFFALGAQTEAISYFEQSLRINTNIYGAESRVVASELNNLGRARLRMNDFEQGIVLAEKALAIQQKILPPLDKATIPTLYTLGMCYESLNRYDEALFYFNQDLEIRKKNFPNDPSYLPGSYSEIGKVYLAKKDYQTALDYFEKGNVILIAINDTNDLGYSYLCHDMGRVHFALKNYDISKKWYEKDIFLNRKAVGKDNEEIAILLTELGNTLSANGKYAEALALFQSASNTFYDNLGPDNTTQYLSESGMAYTCKALYLQSGATEWLEQSRAHFKTAIVAIDRRIRLEHSSAMRRKWLADTKKIFEQAIATEILFQERNKDPLALENAWQLSETMHGFELFAASQEAEARQFSSIPPELLQQEKELRTAMTDLQNQRQQLTERQNLPLTDALVLKNNADYFALKDTYSKLIRHFEATYPDYYHLKYDLQNASIATVQGMLDSSQTLIEYFTGDTTIYIFVIRPGDSQLIQVPHDFPLSEWVVQFRQSILAADNYEQSVRTYAAVAQQLYQKLMVPVAEWMTPETIIIPDGELNYVPFEALLSKTPQNLANFKTYSFLVKNTAVGYAYSATMLQQMIHKQHQRQPAGSLLAVAPFFFGDTSQLVAKIDLDRTQRKGFYPLPHTGEEILRAQKRIGGQSAVLIGSAATLAQFKQHAGEYRVLHLATHGKANESNGEASFIAFYGAPDSLENGLLYVNDLYNLTLNADLVVLSACETGMGQLYPGEGVVSLARAFSFAGAKSVVTSLWSVNDQSSMLLMDHFYDELGQGKTKIMALADAQRNYLNAHPGRESHPFFWAGFVEVGDWKKGE